MDRLRFTFRMPDKLKENLNKRADELGISLNSLILKILWDYLNK